MTAGVESGCAEPPAGPRWVRLRDGQFYLLRHLEPADARTLQAFFYSHSPETIYHRYGHMVAEMTEGRARELVGVDRARHVALAIFDPSPGPASLHAVGRYFLDEDGRGGEVAFVTRESKRNLGMAGVLLSALIALARERGLGRLWASVLAENGAMLGLFRRFHFHARGSVADDSIEMELRLQARTRPPNPQAGAAA